MTANPIIKFTVQFMFVPMSLVYALYWIGKWIVRPSKGDDGRWRFTYDITIAGFVGLTNIVLWIITVTLLVKWVWYW